MDFTRDGRAPINSCREARDPDISDCECLQKYETLLAGYLAEHIEIASEDVFTKQLRLVDEKEKKVYGADFISKLMKMLVESGILAKEKLDDFQWKLVFSDLLTYVRELLKRLSFGKRLTNLT